MIGFGIDPGVHGAVAAVTCDGTAVASELRLAKPEVDVQWLVNWINRQALELELTTDPLVAIEKVGAQKGEGPVGAFTFGYITGGLVHGLAAHGVRIVRPLPRQWKEATLKGTARDKEAANAYVMRKYPSVDLFPGRKRKAHDGIAEAVCIAEWALRQAVKALE